MSFSLKEQIISQSADLCQRFGVSRLGLFGSVARGEDSDNSDIDFLAEFENPVPATMANRYFGFIAEATLRFGRPVQLVTPRMVRNPFLKRSMERDLTMVHGRDFT
jgi:predicted nucleotidyltransferase